MIITSLSSAVQTNFLITWLVSLLTYLAIPPVTEAKANSDDLQSSYEHFWIDYTAALKKIKVEKDNQKAAQMVDQMKKDILPRFGQLVKTNGEWKKSHSEAEIKKMENWVSSNPHANEVSDLQTELMVRSAKEGGALGKAFTDYMKAMMLSTK